MLLASDLTVKITEFTSNNVAPVKWQAPETIKDFILDEKSIIWSFGVVLWELYSFGDIPYPLLVPETLYQFLQSGNRLEKPKQCSTEIYNFMLNIWKFDPKTRLTIQNLVSSINSLMMSTNGGYVRMDSNASEKNKPTLKYEFKKTTIENKKIIHDYVNINALNENKSHYVDMRGKLKPLEMHPLNEIVSIDMDDE